MERQLIQDYERSIGAALAGLTAENLPRAIELASLPERIRGFGHVKAAHLDEVRVRWRELEASLAAHGRAATPVKAA